MPQRAKATQKTMPHNITEAPKLELEPESSPTGPCEASGEELAGAVTGEALLDGIVTGDCAGVAELEGIPAGDSGVGETDGTSATGGAPTGLLTGATTGVSAVGEGVAGDGTGGGDTLLDGLGAGETEDGAGDFAGGVAAGEGVDAVGEAAGEGVDAVGETAGDFEIGDEVGDFAGDAVGDAGECAGGVAGDGGSAGECAVALGDGAGALSARTETECVNNTTRMKNGSNNLLFIFGVFKDSLLEKYEDD